MAGVGTGLFLFLFFLSNSICSGQKNSCSNTSNGTHCGQSESGNCVGYKKNLLTQEDINYLLWVHNSLRENLTKGINEHLPKALHVKELVWNDDLAKMAQKQAEECKPTKQSHLLFHDQLVGQLVLTVEPYIGRNLAEVVHIWTDGLEFLDSDLIGEYQKSISKEFDYGPAAQMIWWNTSQLGCGRSSYELNKCLEKNTKCEVTELVCNYFPAGNTEGDPVYLTKRNSNLLCRYDRNHALCKTHANRASKKQSNSSPLDVRTFGNKIRESMRDLWSNDGSSLAWNKFYLLLLLTTFNVYENLLRN